MKKFYSLFLAFVGIFVAYTSTAQIAVTVTNNTNTTPALAATYTSFSAAVTALNAVTAMTGPVTFTLAAGTSESVASAGGLSIGSATLNPVLSATNTVTIIKAAGAPTILNSATTGTGTPSTANQNGILNIVGADYITIDGLTLTDVAPSGPASMEYGIGLFKLSATDGANFNTIQNCNINLNRENNATGTSPSANGSRGINVVNATLTQQTTNLTITAASGTNSNNKFYSNVINNTNIGISLSGFVASSPYTFADRNNDIGGTSAATGNSIINFGGAAGATNASAGIQTFAQYDLNISFNNINNNNGSGVNHTNVIRAILLNTAAGASSVASNNNISIKSDASSSNLYVIENASGGGGGGNTVEISGNSLDNCSFLNQTTGAFRGIFNSATVSNLRIGSNKFNTVSFNPSGATGGIAFIYQDVVVGNLTDINSNVFEGQSLTTSATCYLIYDSNNTQNISISNNSTNGTITKNAGGNFYGYYNFGSPTLGAATLSGNNFSNITVTGATTFYGLYLATLNSQVEIIRNNVISNITSGTNAAYGIYLNYGAVGSEISGNIVTAMSGNGTIVGIQAGAGTAPLGLDVFSNLVGSLAATSNTTTYGILHQSGILVNSYRNKIYDISNSDAAGSANGLAVTGGGTVNVSNNLIGDIRTPNATGLNALIGLNVTGGTTINLYYNTVHVNGSSSGGTFGSSALSVATTPAVTVRNNIFVNLSTPAGGGFSVAYRRSGTSLTNYGGTSNNNLLYAGSPSANNLIFYDGTNSDQTLANFKTRVTPRDGGSVTESPTFLSLSGLSDDFLHLNPAVATQAESGAVNIASYTNDYDTDIRQGNAGYAGLGTAPDIGADEGNFTLSDLTAPIISNILFTSASCGATNRTFTATISDASGVNNGVFVPRVYYRKNGTGGYQFTTGTLTSGTATNGTWSFNIDYTPILPVVVGDFIQYFVVAQDLATIPNAGGIPSAGLTLANVNSITTPPTTPLQYNYLNALNGTYTVGTAGNYPTLTAAVNAYNTSCLTGPVVFSLINAAPYSGLETFPIVINANSDANSTNTLTIRPAAGITTSITGSNATALIQYNGADYVIIDGSNNGTTSRNLSIINTDAGGAATVIYVNNTAALDAATNNTIKNTIITGSSSTSTLYGIFSGGSTLGNFATAANNNNTYTNNSISQAQNGIILAGTTGNDNNNIINDNNISSLSFRGIFIGNQTNVLIQKNEIKALSSTNGSSANPSGGIIVTSEISGGTITQNTIFDIENTNSGGWASYGISLQSATSNTNLMVSNNVLYDITGFGYAPNPNDDGHGIVVATGGGYKIYYNSVHLNTEQSSAGVSAAMYLWTGLSAGAADIRNNIFATSQTVGTTYPIYCRTTNNAVFSNINNNDYYNTSGPNVGFLASNRTTIASWRTATGRDLNSVNVNPLFVSATDLHLQPTSPLDGLATVIPSITVDFENTVRDLSTPDIGADEFTPPACAGAIGGTASGNGNITLCNSGVPTITATGYSVGAITTYQWQSSTTVGFGSPVDIPGQTIPSALTIGSISSTTYYRLKVTCNTGTSVAFSNVITITVNNPVAPTTVPGARCGNGTVNLSASTPSVGANLDWYTTASGGLSIFTGTNFTTPFITANTTYYVTTTFGGVTENVGKAAPTANSATLFTDAGVVFDANAAITLNSTTVYPNGSGDITIALYNSAGTELASTAAIALSGSGSGSPVIVPLNFSVPIGTGYRLLIKSFNGFASFGEGLVRDFSGNTYPYNSTSGAASIPNSWAFAGSSTNYYFFYNLVISTGCFSNRVPVLATVTPATSISATASPTNICEGLSSTITPTSANAGYRYTYTPTAIISTPGSYAGTASPTSSTVYTVNAIDTTGSGCTAFTTVSINVTPRPATVNINPNPIADICGSGSRSLNALGGLTSSSIVASSGAISLAIPDANSTGVSNTLNVAGIPAGATIDSVIVSFDITHNFDEDVVVNLEGPNGQIINLVSGQSIGSGTNFVGTRISSNNSFSSIGTGITPFTSTYRADAATSYQLAPTPAYTTTNFSNLFGTGNGNWVIRVYDDESIGTGTLTSWSVKVAYRSTPTFTWSPALGLNTTTGSAVIASPTSTQTYTLRATNSAGCFKDTSAIINVTTVDVTIAATPNTAVCPTDPVLFTATPVNPGTTPNYKWLINGVEPTATLTGGSSVGTTVTVASTAGLMVGMRVTVTGGTGAFAVSGLTRVASIISATQFTVDLNPFNVLSGATISATSNGTNIITLTPTNLANGDVVTCRLLSSLCPASPDTSNAITMVVNPGTATSVSIATASTTICSGVATTFTATPTNGGVAPTYEWFVNGVSQGAPSASNTFVTSTLTNGNSVTCRMVSNATNCPVPTNPTSNALVITVNATTTVSLTISSSPAASDICISSPTTFTATPNTGAGNFRFILNGSTTLQSSTSTTYIAPAGSLTNGDVITCELTTNITPCGLPSPVLSTNSLTITVNTAVTASVSISPQAAVCASVASIVYTASPTNGGSGPLYEFFVGGVSQGAPSATPTFTYNSPVNGTNIRVDMTTNNSCATPAISTTNFNQVVNPLPVSTINGNTCLGLPTNLSINLPAVGAPFTYQWRNTSGNIVGATNANYLAAAAETYSVTVTNSSGCSQLSSNTIVTSATPTPLAGVYTIGAKIATAVNGAGTLINSNPGTLQVGDQVSVIAGAGAFAANTIITAITPGTNFTVSNAPSIALVGATVAGTDCSNFTFATAVAALNTASISGNTTFNVTPGYIENTTAQLALGNATLSTATNTRNITFQKNGAGVNPKITTAFAGVTTTPSAIPDGIWSIRGLDNVTIDGIDLQDNNTASAITMMEFGFGLFKLSATDGVKNTTIQNCTITLNANNNALATAPMVEGSIGILSINATATAANTALVVSNATGSNSNNKFYGNTISSVNYGIVLNGFAATVGVGPAPVAATFFGDLSNDIGGTTAVTGNTITAFGSAGVNPAAGIRATNQWSINISRNVVTNTSHSGLLRGIYAESGQSANADISFNRVSINSIAASPLNCTGIENAIGSTVAGNTINILSDTVRNCSLTTVGTTGAFQGIVNTAAAATVNINNNIIKDNLSSGSQTTAGAASTSNMIFNSGSCTNLNVNNNSISNSTNSSAAATWLRGIFVGGVVGTAIVNNNIVTGLSFTNPSCVGTIEGISTGGAASVAQNVTISNNNISSLSTPSTGIITGIRELSNVLSGNKLVTGNTISNFTGTGGAFFNGISGGRAAAGATFTISQNTIFALNSTGNSTSVVNGILSPSAGGTGNGIIERNSIYNLSSSSNFTPTVSGIASNFSTTSLTIRNNVVFDLRTPAANNVDAIRGISLGAPSGTFTYNVFYNTISLNATSTGANFGTSGIYHAGNATNTIAKLNLNDNIIKNISTPNGSGLTVAHRRTGGTAGLANYTGGIAISNYNLLYAGVPSPTRLLYNDGTNSDQTLTAYQTRVSGRDVNSISVIPDFVNNTPTTVNDLQLNPGSNCGIDGAGNNTGTSVTTDYLNAARTPIPATDIGAFEFTSNNTTSLVITNPATSCSVDLTAAGITAGSSAGIGLTYWTNAGATIPLATPNNVTTAGTYYIRGGLGTCFDAVKPVVVTVTAPGTWLGTVNTDWTNASNWCGGVPTGATNVTIPTTANNPVIATTQIANNVTITGTGVLTINGTGNLQVAGSIVSVSNPIVATAGTVTFNGTAAQTVNANHFSGSTIGTLVVNNTNASGLTINAGTGMLNIVNEVNFGNANNQILNTNNLLTLKSTATGTARIGDVTFGGTRTGNDVVGKVVIERFIPARRAWRLLTAPIRSTTLPIPTISANWQEGARSGTLGALADPFPGFGTHISSGPSTALNGFDQNINNNSSIFYLTPTGWNGKPTSTVGTTGTDNGIITDRNAYFIFIRGSRAINLSQGTSAVADATTLRTTGLINVTSNAASPLVVSGQGAYVAGGNTYNSFPNPYPSAINFDLLKADALNSAVPNTYYVWDANLTGSSGVGGWVTVVRVGPGSYTTTPNTPSLNTGNIQSGMAIMMIHSGTVTFKEQYKVSGSNISQYRPVRQIRTNLIAHNADGTESVNDGTLVTFDAANQNSIDAADAYKLPNFAENISISSNNANLAIERRQNLQATDTIFITMDKMRNKAYHFAFELDNMQYPAGKVAVLEDTYLQTETPINVTGTTNVNFEVNSANAGSIQKDRFRIVFKDVVKYTSIKAYVADENIAVDWKVSSELNIANYVIERSSNGGVSFEAVGTQVSNGNSRETVQYTWYDVNPIAGSYIYRVKCISNNGAFAYSDRASATIVKGGKGMYVFPNPVTNNVIGIQLNKVKKGIYTAVLKSKAGQIVMTTTISHAGGSAAYTISPTNRLVSGNYTVEIIGDDNTVTVLKVIAQTK